MTLTFDNRSAGAVQYGSCAGLTITTGQQRLLTGERKVYEQGLYEQGLYEQGLYEHRGGPLVGRLAEGPFSSEIGDPGRRVLWGPNCPKLRFRSMIRRSRRLAQLMLTRLQS